MQRKPSFIITIDTEGDNIWSRPQEVKAENALFLPRFQELCEKYKLKPTYLTNYEMASSESFQEFGNDIIKRGTGEIGMHLHAFNSPPAFELTENDYIYHPYLIEYPENIMEDKIKFMTELLEDKFGTKMLSHRAGRWSFDKTYANLLIKYGYKVDCSVTPHVSWKGFPGDPAQAGGTDFSRFPEEAYFLDTDDISRPGNSSLLEVPMSITDTYALINMLSSLPIIQKNSLPRRGLNYLFPKIWLRPKRNNIKHLYKYIDYAIHSGKQYVEFMLHSSEFMPGGSPTFKSEESIDKLYDTIEQLFERATSQFEGQTLSEYYYSFKQEAK